MGQLWIEGAGNDGEAFSARWGEVTDEQIDTITDYIESVLGRADTVC